MTPLPDPWTGFVIGMATYRLVRLGGWDDWPPIYRLRAWIIGERWIPDLPSLIEYGERIPIEPSSEGGITKIPAPGNFFIDGGEISLPGKQPDTEVDAVRPAYDRPLLAHLFHCPFCLSFWISLLVYGAWLWQPTWSLVVLFPFVLSGFAGLVAKNLDA